MATYLAAVAAIFAIACVGILVDRSYRRFAADNPRLGPFRDPGKCGCCSSGSGCSDASCDTGSAMPGAPH